MEMLGRAQRAAVFKERTTMIATGDHEEEVNKRIAQVKAEGQATDSEFDREKAEERVAKLGGAIGRIKVGAATETELKDKKLRYEDALNSLTAAHPPWALILTSPGPCRYEDALNSVKAAMDEGIVPGGGSTLVYLLRTKEKVHPTSYILHPTSYILHPASYILHEGEGAPRPLAHARISPSLGPADVAGARGH